MYGIFTYIWVIIRANVGKYTIHGAYGIYNVGPIDVLFPLVGWKIENFEETPLTTGK